jgi:hypothetical protein
MIHRFLIFLFVGGITAAVWVSINERAFERALATATKAYLCDSSAVMRIAFPTLVSLKDEESVDRYFDVVTGRTNKLTSGIVAISEEQGFSVYIIDYNSDSSLCRVYIRRDKHSMMKPREEKHWIWRGYLCFP